MIEYKIIKIADFFESIKVSGNITFIAILNTSYMTFSRANFVYSPPPSHLFFSKSSLLFSKAYMS